MSERNTPESGLFTGLVNFYRESTTGSFNTDPDYTTYSDEVVDVSWSPGYSVNEREALGSADTAGHDKGMEEGEITVTYRLQRQLVDGNGDPDDPAGDAFDRNSDDRIKNTHGIRIRDGRSTTDPDDPASASGARMYVIGQGGHPDADFEDAADDGSPLEMTLTYMCEKVRNYEIFQPDGTEALDVVSSDSGDTSQTLTIEDDTGTSEAVSLNGTSAVTTTKADWDSIRGLELDAETTGDITISTSSSGDTLATIRGSEAYSNSDDGVEGDLGVPVIGSGSLGSAVTNNLESITGATIQRGGSSFAYDVAQASASVSNNYDPNARHETFRPRFDEGNRDTSVEFDLVGWGASADFIDQMARTATDDVVVELQKTTFTWSNAVIEGTDDVERGPDDSAIAFGITASDSDDGGLSIAQP
jgi:hypothetical protein